MWLRLLVHTVVYEPVDVIDVDEPVWVMRTTEQTATTSTQSLSLLYRHQTMS